VDKKEYQHSYYVRNKEKRNAQSAAWRLNNLDRHREITRNSVARARKNKPNLYLHRMAKRRAQQFGLEFNIEPSDIKIPLICPLLGVWMSKSAGRLGPCSPTLDRIDSTKGYTKGNIWVISHRANTAKSDLTIDEFLRMADNIRKLLVDFG
jgi:hypothetical protein